MLIVLDTNVLVSGLSNSHWAPGRILDLIIAGELTLAYDDRVMSEYAEVLKRPKFGFAEGRVQAVLDFLQLAGDHVYSPPLQVGKVPDVDDLVFGEVAAAAQAEAVVTGNPEHFEYLEGSAVRVLSPRAFLDQWPGELAPPRSAGVALRPSCPGGGRPLAFPQPPIQSEGVDRWTTSRIWFPSWPWQASNLERAVSAPDRGALPVSRRWRPSQHER